MGNVTNYHKHGYFHGINDMEPKKAFIIFCKRRSGDVVKEMGHSLPYDEMLARIYYQGLMDGKDIYAKEGG